MPSAHRGERLVLLRLRGFSCQRVHLIRINDKARYEIFEFLIVMMVGMNAEQSTLNLI